MDLWSIHVRHGETFLYSGCWHQRAQGSRKIPFQTHLYDYRRENHAQDCLTVSNLKLDDVFSDVLGKSSRSITEQILQHPGEIFDAAPFVHRRCKTPIAEIQAAVDGAVSKEQAAKLRQCLDHIDELQRHISEAEQEILRLSDKYDGQDAVLEMKKRPQNQIHADFPCGFLF